MPGQAGLFDNDSGAVLTVERLGLPGADILFFPAFFRAVDADRLLDDIDETTIWDQETFKMYGKEMPIPRLTAWYGDPGKSYKYSKISMDPRPWTPPLLEIKSHIETETRVEFNSVLLNLYRNGNDGVLWHSDDERELGNEPAIASVSFGESRRFQLRHRDDSNLRRDIELTHGSLLLMRGATQLHWEHQVPKTARRVGPRINLTFRFID